VGKKRAVMYSVEPKVGSEKSVTFREGTMVGNETTRTDLVHFCGTHEVSII